MKVVKLICRFGGVVGLSLADSRSIGPCYYTVKKYHVGTFHQHGTLNKGNAILVLFAFIMKTS